MKTETHAVPAGVGYRPSAVLGFLAVHAAALGVFWIGFSWKGVALCVAS